MPTTSHPRLTRPSRRLGAITMCVAGALAVAAPAAPAALSTRQPPAASFGPGLGRVDPRADSAFSLVYRQLADGWRRRDVDQIAGLHAADARLLAAGDSILQGRAAIRERYRTLLRPTAEVGAQLGPRVRFEILDRVVAGSVGWDVGYLHHGEPWGEHFDRVAPLLVLWQRDTTGTWRISADGTRVK